MAGDPCAGQLHREPRRRVTYASLVPQRLRCRGSLAAPLALPTSAASASWDVRLGCLGNQLQPRRSRCGGPGHLPDVWPTPVRLVDPLGELGNEIQEEAHLLGFLPACALDELEEDVGALPGALPAPLVGHSIGTSNQQLPAFQRD